MSTTIAEPIAAEMPLEQQHQEEDVVAVSAEPVEPVAVEAAAASDEDAGSSADADAEEAPAAPQRPLRTITDSDDLLDEVKAHLPGATSKTYTSLLRKFDVLVAAREPLVFAAMIKEQGLSADQAESVFKALRGVAKTAVAQALLAPERVHELVLTGSYRRNIINVVYNENSGEEEDGDNAAVPDSAPAPADGKKKPKKGGKKAAADEEADGEAAGTETAPSAREGLLEQLGLDTSQLSRPQLLGWLSNLLREHDAAFLERERMLMERERSILELVRDALTRA